MSMKRSLSYYLLRALTGPLVERLWIGAVTGLEAVPRSGPCIVIANHASYLDFILLSTLFEYRVGRPIHFWAKRKVTEGHPLFRHYARAFQAIPVEAGSSDYWERTLTLLEGGSVVGIFPEGTRSRSGRLRPFHTGYLRLAAAAGVPVVPVVVAGAYEILPPDRRWPRRRRAAIHCHPPFTVPADLDREAVARLNRRVRDRYFGDDGPEEVA